MKGDYWLYFNQVLDPSWCDYIIEYCTENYEPRDAVIGFEDANDDPHAKANLRLNPETKKQ